MFALICLFFPTFISLYIVFSQKEYDYRELLIKYPIYNIAINIISFVIVGLYVKGDVITSIIFNNLNFCIKYLILSSFIAIILPYVIKFLCKNLQFKIEVRKNEK